MDVFFDTPPSTRRISGGFFPTFLMGGDKEQSSEVHYIFFFCFSPKMIILLDKDLLLGVFMSAIYNGTSASHFFRYITLARRLQCVIRGTCMTDLTQI